MHEIDTHVIDIQIAEIPMKLLSFLNRNHAVCSFLNICVNCLLRHGLGQCRCVLCCDRIIGRVSDCWANRDAEPNAHKLIVT